MPADPRLTSAEEGKTVETTTGEQIGRITTVKNNVAAVEADPGLTDRIGAALGWETADPDTDTYRVQASDVAAVEEGTVIVHGDFDDAGADSATDPSRS